MEAMMNASKYGRRNRSITTCCPSTHRQRLYSSEKIRISNLKIERTKFLNLRNMTNFELFLRAHVDPHYFFFFNRSHNKSTFKDIQWPKMLKPMHDRPATTIRLKGKESRQSAKLTKQVQVKHVERYDASFFILTIAGNNITKLFYKECSSRK